jgi:hypothetical protein
MKIILPEKTFYIKKVKKAILFTKVLPFLICRDKIFLDII